MKKVAIFDIDGTIFRSSLLIELVNVMIEQGIFDPDLRKQFDKEHKNWLERKGDYGAYIGAVVKVFDRNIKGVHYSKFSDAAKIVVDRYQNHTYRYTRNLIAELKRKKYYLLAITHSPKGVADIFCKNIGFDKVYGRLLELGPTDRFTGRLMEESTILNKANVIKRAVEKEGLTLEDSVGVGDTESDIPMLEKVTTAICFNPNMRLYRYAKINGWKVVVERKDVIYELS